MERPDWANINDPDTSAVGFVEGPALSAENAATLDEFIAGLADGSINLYTGPLNWQDGSTFLADGETATDLADLVPDPAARRAWRARALSD